MSALLQQMNEERQSENQTNPNFPDKKRYFTKPIRAALLSTLFMGLGQIYTIDSL